MPEPVPTPASAAHRSPGIRALGAALLTLAAGAGVLSMRSSALKLEPRTLSDSTRAVAAARPLGERGFDLLFESEREVIRGRCDALEARAVWQWNAPVELQGVRALDLDGDGGDETLVALRFPDHAEVVVVDTAGQLRMRLGPYTGPAEPRTSPWNGWLCPIGVAGGDSSRVIVCFAVAMRTQRPRALVAFDATSGARRWSYELGSWPQDLLTADVDGDGSDEILLGTSATDNGIAANGSDDAHAYVVCVGADGGRRWQVAVGEVFSHALLLFEPARAPGGSPRVVAGVSSHRGSPRDPGRLYVLQARDGDLLARRDFDWNPGRPLPGAFEHEAFVVAGSDGMLRAFDDELELRRSARSHGAAALWGFGDLDGDGRGEYVASTQEAVRVFDARLRERGAFVLRGRPGAPPPVVVASERGGRAWLVTLDGGVVQLRVAVRPLWNDPLPLGAVAGLAAVAGALAGLLPQRLRAAREGARDDVREFLVDYHQVHHETFDQQRPFARLRLWAQSEEAGNPMPEKALRSAFQEFSTVGGPALIRFAQRARSLGVPRATAGAIVSGTRRAERALRDAAGSGGERRRDHVEAALGQIDALSQHCLDAYLEVARRRPCRPQTEIAAVIGSRAEAPEWANVKLVAEGSPEARRPVLFEALDLREVMSELLRNATRAVGGAARPEIRVRVIGHPRDPRYVLVQVLDNGPGIPAGERENVFRPVVSERAGGGFGLAYAREVARRWLGDLVADEPPEGFGALITLSLRVVPEDARASHDGGTKT